MSIVGARATRGRAGAAARGTTADAVAGRYHRVKNAGQTLFRKMDINYLRDRAKHVPAWALKPAPKEKGGKKKKGKGKKKK